MRRRAGWKSHVSRKEIREVRSTGGLLAVSGPVGRRDLLSDKMTDLGGQCRGWGWYVESNGWQIAANCS